MTVGVLATLRIDAAQIEAMRAALLRLAEQSALEAGTELFAVHETIGDPGHFVVFERYRDDDAVRAHRGSAAMEDFRLALRAAGTRPELFYLAPVTAEPRPGPAPEL
jgi:quinol monooxygenase YgiN